jgi:hypothetical protein
MTVTYEQMIYIEADKFLEYSLNIYQRFILNVNMLPSLFFNVWTFYGNNFIQKEEIYALLKILCGPDKLITFEAPNSGKPEQIKAKLFFKTITNSVNTETLQLNMTLELFTETFQNTDLFTNAYCKREYLQKLFNTVRIV